MRYRAVILVVLFRSTAILAGQETKPTPGDPALADFLSPNARETTVIQSTGEVRKVVPAATTSVRPTATVVTASIASGLGMQWAEAVEVHTLVCDDQTIELVKNAITALLAKEQFKILDPWNGPGFLKVSRDTYNELVKTAPPQNETMHLVVKIDGRPKDLAQYITLIYELRAGPRPKYDQKSWSDHTNDPTVAEYIGHLKALLLRDALATMTDHCNKLDSGPALSEQAALEKIERQLAPAQAQALRTALKKSQK